ncbi:hypothetical protein N7486_004179 [Penicillium sp. IBT 16267x]|nr:hypothetical protein N7486_004179 [Penicillium sp. IBT 16267x]
MTLVNPMSISAILNKPSELRKDGTQPPEEEEKTSAQANKKVKRREKRKENTASVKVAHAPSAQILYQVTRDGAAQLRPIPVDRAAAWKSLSVVSSSHLPRRTVHHGDIVIVDIGPRGIDYAKVSDLRRFSDGRYVIVYAWLYTRNEIARELEVDAILPAHALVHLDIRIGPSRFGTLTLQ